MGTHFLCVPSPPVIDAFHSNTSACTDPPMYLYFALFPEVVYFDGLMDLNKVNLHMAPPKPLPLATKWEKEDQKSSHVLNGCNGATCWLVLVMTSYRTV